MCHYRRGLIFNKKEDHSSNHLYTMHYLQILKQFLSQQMILFKFWLYLYALIFYIYWNLWNEQIKNTKIKSIKFAENPTRQDFLSSKTQQTALFQWALVSSIY